MIVYAPPPPWHLPDGVERPRLERLAAIRMMGVRLKSIKWVTSPVLPSFGVPEAGLMITTVHPRIAWAWTLRDGSTFSSPPLMWIGFPGDDPHPTAPLN